MKCGRLSPRRVGNRVKGILSFTKESIPLLIPREKGFPLQASSLKSCGACRLHFPARGEAALALLYLRAALPRLVLLYDLVCFHYPLPLC